LLSLVISLLWLVAPYAAYIISRPYVKRTEQLGAAEIQRLRRLARKTWRYFEDFAVKEENYLPPDNYQEDPPKGCAHRTSPTNIGLLLMSVLSAGDLGFLDMKELAVRIDRIISTVERMEKWKGHLFNWYNTITLDTLRPLYVSTVDSGNFVGYLMVLREGLREYIRRPLPGQESGAGLLVLLKLLSEEDLDTGAIIEKTGLEKAVAEGSMEPAKWCEILTELKRWNDSPDAAQNLKKSDWGGKFTEQLHLCINELAEFFPAFENDSEFKLLDELEAGFYEILTTAASPESMVELYERACLLVEKHLEQSDFQGDSGRREAMNRLAERIRKAASSTGEVIILYKSLIDRVGRLIDATEFTPLFEHKRQLFSIGFNVEDGHLSKSYYDLLASEARQASYIAVARGEVERRHWSKLGRKLTSVDGFKGLVSWTGTMFEYLMPLLIMRNYENTIFDETYSFVVRAQKKYGRQRKIPWGVSESGYHAFDINLNY